MPLGPKDPARSLILARVRSLGRNVIAPRPLHSWRESEKTPEKKGDAGIFGLLRSPHRWGYTPLFLTNGAGARQRTIERRVSTQTRGAGRVLQP